MPSDSVVRAAQAVLVIAGIAVFVAGTVQARECSRDHYEAAQERCGPDERVGPGYECVGPNDPLPAISTVGPCDLPADIGLLGFLAALFGTLFLENWRGGGSD